MAFLLLLRRRRRPTFTRIRHFSALPDLEPLPSPKPSPTPQPPTTSSSILALQLAIRSEPDPDRIHSLVVSSLSTIPRLHSSRPLFSLAVSRLSRLRRPDLASSLLSHLLSHPSSPRSDGLLARALSLFSLASLPDPAVSAFSCSPASSRSDLSLSALLSTLLRSARLADVKSTFSNAAADFGVTPGRASHNVLLHALVKNGELAAARQLLDEMARQSINRPMPDIVSYNTVLAGFLDKDDDEGFEALLKEINSRGLEQNVVTYYCRINRFVKRGESFKGEELVDVMEKKGVAPNFLTYNALVHGYCKEGDVGSAMRVFKRMKVMKRREGISGAGVSANSNTYVVLLRGLVEKGRFDDALWICKSCLAMKAAPPFEAVKGLVDGLVKESKVAEAKDVVAKMSMIVKGDAKVAWEKLVGELSLEEDMAGSS